MVLYLEARPWVRLYADDEQAIMDTMKHYLDRGKNICGGFVIPVQRVERVEICCALGMMRTKDFFDIQVLPDFVLNMNANAFSYVQDLVDRIEDTKRGGLYKFVGDPLIPLLEFIPERLVQALQGFGWKRYDAVVDEMLDDRRRSFEEIFAAHPDLFAMQAPGGSHQRMQKVEDDPDANKN